MSDFEKESARLYRELSESQARRPQLLASLSRIKEACDDLDRLRAPIEVSSVAELIESKQAASKGPTAGSIRNQKETLLQYLYLRRAEQNLPKNLQDDNSTGPVIRDPKVSEYVRLIQQKLRRITADRDRLVNAMRMLSPVSSAKLLGDAPSSATSLSGNPIDIDEHLRDAAASLLNKKNLELLGLEIADVQGKLVLRSRFQLWVLFWEPSLLALAKVTGLTIADLRGLARKP